MKRYATILISKYFISWEVIWGYFGKNPGSFDCFFTDILIRRNAKKQACPNKE